MNQPLILVADDEEHVGTFAAWCLRRAGFRTVRASSGRSALDIFTAEVELVLTDWTMPDLTGGELAAQLQGRKPTLQVLFMSGNSELSMEPDSFLKRGENFILKPFGGEELIHFVKNALTAKGEGTPA